MPEFSGSGETEIKEWNLSLALDQNKKIPSTGNMRHLKRYNQLFESTQVLTQEQKDWLDEFAKVTWIFNPQTGLVDVVGSFDCSEQGLRLRDFKGVRFGHVEGYFNCGNNSLTSLEGAPQSVDGDFYCFDNQLTSLKGAPQSVGGNFDCGDNQLTSLEGAPQSVGGDFSCSNNFLVSLEGAPQSVGRDFVCNYNQLVSLKGAPQKVANDFKCIGNPLTSLEGAPQNVGRNFYFIFTPISDAIATRVLRRMSEKKVPLEQAVSDLWDLIPGDDRIYLAKHNPDLSPEERREYMALERHKKRLI